ncbi:MAG: efflux transporter outer membrane subunit [Planctomycetes bacterium]|nr:efflux transporter outer membrane subunit [Planctomycetota bacterium]
MKVPHATSSFRGAGGQCGALAMLALTGCAVGPDFVPPETTVPANWHARIENGLAAEETDPGTLAEWWTTLGDPDLSRLMERAVAGNLDLKRARSRIREARARRGLARSGFFPMFDAAASATFSRTSKEPETGGGRSREVYAAGLDAGWELDIFGGVRRSVEAAEADLQATEEDLRDVLVSLLAETALSFVDVRAYQARIAAAEASLAAQDQTYQLTLWRCQAGLDDELAVRQARYNLENTRSQVPALRAGLEETLNGIAILLGEAPGRIHRELAKPGPIPVPPPKVAVGVPADVVRRRPDVRRAERELAAQTARVGVAEADLYPRLTLSGSIGVEALKFSDLSTSPVTASGGPRLSWAIFNPAVRPNIEIQSALQEQALIAYEATVLGSLEEVENALVAYSQERSRRDALGSATQAAQEAAELAQDKYQAGLADFTSVLDAERSLLSFQDQLIQSDATVTAAVIRLYKALGGGWTSLALAEASPEAEPSL